MRPVLASTGLGRGRVSIRLSEAALHVRAGIWFRATIPRSAIRAVTRQRDAWWAIGVHTDFRRSWLVNGSPRGIVAVELEHPVPARVAGIPVKVRRLGLSVEDPDGFIAAVGPPPPDD